MPSRQQLLSVLGITIIMVTSALLIFTIAVPMGQTTPEPASAQVEIRPGPVRSRTAQRTDISKSPTAGAQKAKAAAPEVIQDQWQVIYLENQRIGFSHTKAERSVRNGLEIIRTATDDKLKIKRAGDPLEIGVSLVTEETADGGLLSYDLKINNPPAAPSRAVGRANGNRLDIETTINGATRKSSIDWRTDVKSPAWQDRLLRTARLRPGQTNKFDAFVPEFSRIASIVFTGDDFRPVKLFDGSRDNLLRVRVTSSLSPNTPLAVYLDASGDIRKTETLLLGKQMASFTVPAEEAMKELSGAGFDIGIESLIKVDPPLRAGHSTKKAVYRISVPGKDPSKSFVEGPNQKIRKIDDNTIELTVTVVPIPKEPRRVPGPAEYVQPTRFIQSDDPHVVSLARSAASGRIDHGVVAATFERFVYLKVAKKNFSTAMASAGEVAQTLTGDCTEHAVLLAAMLRARQIPSRVAVGLVYVEGLDVFGGHMWTEAWMDGQWIPLDATLGRGGTGAAHLKMSDSSLSDNAPAPFATFLPLIEVLGTMKVEVVSSE